MAPSALKKFVICLAASATALGAGASALAGGYASFGYGSGYYGGHGYYAAGHSHHRGYRGHRHHRRGGGGKGAAIALGVIGGAILLSEAARADERRRIAEERYYRDRYYRDRYERRRYESRDYDRDYIPQRDYESDAEDIAPSDDLDGVLEGGAAVESDGPGPIAISYRGAYETCKTHARRALGNRGFILAAPARPETAEEMGGAYRITATVIAENQRGESWRRAMYCEATDDRVYLLELI